MAEMEQDVDPSDYPYAFLTTAPRFLGYHFNPVSFWYLYSSEKVLSAIVLDVNNTFDERRTYFVLRDSSGGPHAALASSDTRQRIRGSWAKDFHMSPFNSRKGTYSILARDPLGPGLEGFRGLDITVNLESSAGHAKFYARLFSEGAAVDPSTMSAIHTVRFLLGWGWVGFATFPRIITQAAVLFFRRKLHVWYRPEPLKETQGRRADPVESALEGVFRKYLQYLVRQSPRSVSVRYVPSGMPSLAAEVFTSSTTTDGPGAAEHVEIKILTPLFYSRFAHCTHGYEAMLSELTQSRTVWVDKPYMLPAIFIKRASSPLHKPRWVDIICFRLIQSLRRRPKRIQTSTTSADCGQPAARDVDVGDFHMSSMDAFVVGLEDGDVTASYRSVMLRLVLADLLLMGQTGLVRTVELAARVGLAWTVASLVMNKMR